MGIGRTFRAIGHGLLALMLPAAGCQSVVQFPAQPLHNETVNGRTLRFDTDGDGRADYGQQLNAAGRVIALEFDDDGDGRFEQRVELDRIDPAAVPHLMILLDGGPLRVLEDLRREGRFRLFGPTTEAVSVFPAMTDLSINRLLGTGPSPGYEARYYDRARNTVVGGTGSYVEADHSPWVGRVDYRISFARDADAYLNPKKLFADELAGMLAVFNKARGPGTVIGYSVGTAGLATTGGEPAVREYLTTVDRLAEQIMHDRRGQVRITVLADHGHNLKAGNRVSFRKFLLENGWDVQRQSLHDDNDVLYIEYGLVTYAAFFTRQPARLADLLATHPAADLTMYRDGDEVIVIRGDERAAVSRAAPGGPGGPGRYRYRQISGDPLKLAEILAQLKADGKVAADGAVEPEALFAATLHHEYPDPLRRVFLAFDELVRNPADVLVSLKDPHFHGWPFFAFMIHERSTHGSLNRLSSNTFIITTGRPLPAAIRQEQFLESIGLSWPTPTTAPARE